MNKVEYFSKVQEVLTEVLKDKKYLKECRGYALRIKRRIYYKNL